LVGSSSASSFRRRPESSLPAAPERRWIPDQVRDDGRWGRALAAYRAAEAGVREEERRTAGLSMEEEAAREEIYGAQLDALYATLRRLLKVPAPDVGALAAKIELMIDHEVATLTGGEACLAAIRRDARRLAG
jgi:hypothetical protein